MKFHQFSALQKHIRSSSALKQLPVSYLIVHPQREERRKLLEKLCAEIKTYETEASTVFLEAEESSWRCVDEALMTPSLFGEVQIVVWEGISSASLAGAVPEKLLSYVLSPSPRVFFILSAEQAKGFGDFYQKAKQELIFLDFSEEKPWEKQKRVQQEMFQLAQKEGKVLSPAAYEKLCFFCGTDPLVLESELLKAVAYVGDRKEIGEKDINEIASSSAVATGWTIAEGLVWGEAAKVPSSLVDTAFLLSLLGQVRFYVQQGRQVGWCVQAKLSPEEIQKKLPQVKPAQMQKLASALRYRQMRYFDEALKVLYEIELLSKNSGLPPLVLFDLLQLKLTHLKHSHTLR